MRAWLLLRIKLYKKNKREKNDSRYQNIRRIIIDRKSYYEQTLFICSRKFSTIKSHTSSWPNLTSAWTNAQLEKRIDGKDLQKIKYSTRKIRNVKIRKWRNESCYRGSKYSLVNLDLWQFSRAPSRDLSSSIITLNFF